jgi:hypothetical protein
VVIAPTAEVLLPVHEKEMQIQAQIAVMCHRHDTQYRYP